MLGGYPGAVVVVACIRRLDRRVRLSRERTNHVREHVVRQPTYAVVVGLPRPHSVARAARVAIGAVGISAFAGVIPRREEGARWADRKVGLPIRTIGGIGVQLHRRAKGHTAVGGANVIDVSRITAGAVLVIDQVNDVVEGRRFAPALMPPVTAVSAKDTGEVANTCNTRVPEKVGRCRC